MARISVATVILNFRAPDDTVNLVESLRRSKNLDQRIIVCDNGPADDDHKRLRHRLGDGVDVIATGANLGYAGGNNVGLRHAMRYDPAYFWVLNPDAEVEPATLDLLLATAAAVPDAGVLGPRILYPDRSRIWFDGGVVDATTWGNTSHLHNGAQVASTPPSAPRDVDYVTGAALLIAAPVIRAVGLLPEHYFLYFEETSYCRDVAAAGWRVLIEPRATMVHHKRSSGTLPTRYYLYYMTRNRIHFGRAHFGASPDQVLSVWRPAFLDPWRARVERIAPAWVQTFDAIVEHAIRDGRGDVYGPADLDAYSDPDLLPAPEVSR